MGNVQSGTAETARALPRGPLGIGCSSSASLGMDFLSLLAHPSWLQSMGSWDWQLKFRLNNEKRLQ